MSEIHLTDENFAREVLEYKGVALVDFWAPWCGPCRMLGPVVEELAKEYAGKAKICKLNTDDSAEKSVEYRISSIPTIIIFKDGKPQKQLIGLQSKEELKKQLDALL